MDTDAVTASSSAKGALKVTQQAKLHQQEEAHKGMHISSPCSGLCTPVTPRDGLVTEYVMP